MSFETDIVTIIQDWLGYGAYPDQIEEGATYPAVAYVVDAVEHLTTWAGATGMARADITLSAYTKTKQATSEAAEAIRNRLHGKYRADYAGLSQTYDAMFVEVGSTFHDSDTGTYQQDLSLEMHASPTN